MAGIAHTRLRAATRTAHESVEAKVDFLTRAADSAARRSLVAAFHRMHAEAETALAPWLEDVEGLDFAERRRAPGLARDLIALGVEAPDVPKGAGAVAVAVASRDEALGRLYVLEGSTLGGQVIRRALAERGQPMTGLSFLDPYGPRTGERWRSFLAVLETADDGAALLAGAMAGFAHAELRLTREPADV